MSPITSVSLTGCQKIHHLAESRGVDVEVHACRPAHRHLMAASRNSNFYEVVYSALGMLRQSNVILRGIEFNNCSVILTA